MGQFEYILVAGPLAGGKTNGVNGLRGPEYAESLHIPSRFLTRYELPGDDSHNKHLDVDEFEAGVVDGSIWPHWGRKLDIGDPYPDLYGFDATIPEDEPQPDPDERTTVLGINNGFLRASNESTEAVIPESLIVIMWATVAKREERLIDAGRRASRSLINLQDDLIRPDAPIKWIDTTGFDEPEEGQAALREVIDQVI